MLLFHKTNFSLLTATSGSIFHVLDLSSNPGLLKIKKDDVFIQKGCFKIIHVIDLHNLKITLEQIDNIHNSLDNENALKNVLQTKIIKLRNTFNKIFPKRIRRSWDGLGRAIKWMAGVADADDLRAIKNNFTEINDLENSLVQNNNKQIDVNTLFEDKINALSKQISESIADRLNETANSLDIINLMFNIDIVQNKLENIVEAISLARLKLIGKNILEESEIELILEKFDKQNFTLSSTSEYFTFLIPEIEYKDDEILYYHISIPQLVPFENYRIEPLTKNGQEIKIDYNEILINENSTFAINHQCLENSGKTVCLPEHIIEVHDEDCIPLLLKGKPGNCVWKKVAAKPSIKSIGDGKLLIKNAAQPTKVKNTCGTADQIIIGNFFISFSNCSVSINGETFENVEVKHREKFELLPSFEMKIKQRNIEPLIDLHSLHDLHIKNREKLREIHENYKDSETTFFISFATFGLIATIIIAIAAGASWIFFKKVESIRRLTSLKGEELHSASSTASSAPASSATAPFISLFNPNK